MNLHSFLHALRDDPDDLGQRLVFADWLEDNGESDRAELMRLQCAAAPTRPFWDEREDSYSSRELELMTAIAARHGELPAVLAGDVDLLDVWFRHGTLRLRSVSYPDLEPPHDLVVGLLRSGWVERVQVEARGGLGFPFGELRAVTWLSLQSERGLSPEMVAAILALLPQLRRLELRGVRFWEGAPDVLNALPQLDFFRWSQANLSDVQIRLLAPVIARCRTLELDRSPLGDRGLAALLDAVAPGRLRGLGLSATALSAKGAARLAACDRLAGLTALSIGLNPLGDTGAAALAASPHLRRLAHLQLRDARLTTASVESLAASAVLGNLLTLDLSRNFIDSRGACALADSPHLGRLRSLNLHDCEITEAGARDLVLSDRLDGLTEIDLTENHIEYVKVGDGVLSPEQWRELFGLSLTDDPSLQDVWAWCRLLAEGSPPVRRRVAGQLAWVWKRQAGPLPPVESALVAALEDPEDAVRTSAAGALKVVTPTESAVQLVELLGSAHWESATCALDCLGRVGERAAGLADAILDRIEGRAEFPAADLAHALASVGAASPRAVEAFRRWARAEEDYSGLSLSAARGLAQCRLDLPTVTGVWLSYAAPHSKSDGLARALGRWPEAVERLVAASAEAGLRGREIVVLAHAQEARATALPALVRYLGDPTESVRAAALEAVLAGGWRAAELVPPLIALLGDERHERPAIQALRVQGEHAAAAVPELLRVGVERRRHDAFLLLRDLGPLTRPRADAFRQQLRRDDPEQARLARLALRQCRAHWPDADALVRDWRDEGIMTD